MGTCSWNKLNQELQTGRRDFVAMPIHDAWTACKPGEKVSKSVDETNICYGNDCFSDMNIIDKIGYVEFPDSDYDGIPDNIDTDDDNDGIPDDLDNDDDNERRF